MMNKLIFIVGLQKSGTSLLVNLLEHSGVAKKLYAMGSEGNDIWGQHPCFSPTDYPVGTLYQRFGLTDGHQLDETHATDEIKHVIRERIARACKYIPPEVIGFSKDTYNSVRVPWLRALFPDSVIISVLRNPHSNIYSLWKRFIPPYYKTQPPEEGWWGVKPYNWRQLRSDDVLLQLSKQWQHVTEKLWKERCLIDMTLDYKTLCRQPELTVRRIFDLSARHTLHAMRQDWPDIQCLDDEFKVGGTLQSMNHYSNQGQFTMPTGDCIDVPSVKPFTQKQAQLIDKQCLSLWQTVIA